MKRADLLDTIAALERSLDIDPDDFRRSVRRQLILAALPFVAFFGTIVAVAAWIAFTALVDHRMHHPLLDVAFGVLFALVGIAYRWRRVAIPARPALPLDRKVAAKLFEVLDRAHASRALSPHLSAEPTPLRIESPSGLFSFGSLRLVIGLPLALAVDADDLETLVDVEARWVVRAEARLLFWADRLMAGYAVLRDARAAKWSSNSLVDDWMPRIARAHLGAFVLARRARREVERVVRARVGEVAFVGAFARAASASRWLDDEFYRHVLKQSQRNADPSRTIFNALMRQLETRDANDERWLDEAFLVVGDPLEMIPTVASIASDAGVSREAIHESAVVSGESAASVWFADSLAPLAAECNAFWFHLTAPRWRVEHERARTLATMCASLEARGDNVTADDERVRVYLVLQTRGAADALPFARAAFERHPRDTKIESLLAVCLVESGDERGLAHAERVIEIEPAATHIVAGPVYAFCVRTGRAADARRWRERRLSREWLESQADRERRHVERDTIFDPHGFSGAELLGVMRVLSSLPWVRDAYLVKRRVEFLRDEPNWLLVVIARKGWFGDDPAPQDGISLHIAMRLGDLERDITVRSASSIPRWLEKKLTATTGGSLPIERARAAREGKASWPVRPEDIAKFLTPRSASRTPLRLSFVAAVALVLLTLGIVVAPRLGLGLFTANRAAVLGLRIGAMDRGGFAPVTAPGRVARVRALRGLAVGTRCEVELSPPPPSSESFNCPVTVRCSDNQRVLYDGFTQCAIEHDRPVRALDPFGDDLDGDAAMEFDAAHHRAVVDDGAAGMGGRLVVITLDEVPSPRP